MRLEAGTIRITGGTNLPRTQKKKTLILNADYSPWNVKDSVEAYKNYLLPGKVTGKPSGRLVEEYEDDPIRGATFFDEKVKSLVQRVFPRPAVIVLNGHQNPSRRMIRVSRDNVFIRDNYTCFTPNTEILMADWSLKKISEIEIGDEIIDGITGDTIRVKYVHSRVANDNEMIQIRHRGNGESLYCTKNHKILTWDWDGHCTNENGIKAGSLSSDDYLAEVIPNINCRSKEYDLADICSELKYLKVFDTHVKNYCGHNVNRHIMANSELGKLIGYYLSEGSIVQKNKLEFTFHRKESSYYEEVQSLLLSIFGVKSKIDNTRENTTIVRCCDSVVCKFIDSLFGSERSKDLNINYPHEFRIGILYGILRGDANFNMDLRRCVLQMSREDMIKKVYLLALSVGLKPTLSKTGERPDGRIYKSVVFNASEFNKICDICEVSFTPYVRQNKIYRKYINNHAISKVVEIDEYEYKGLVYDLEVGGTHTYVANFVCVHNCQYCGRNVGYNLGDAEGPNGFSFSLKPTWDHVVPRERGGKSTFLNTVCCCTLCNSEKANRLLKDARHSNGRKFQLLREPVVPNFLPPVRFLSHVRDYNADKWLPYIPDAEKYIERVRLKPTVVQAVYNYYGIDKELPEHVLSYDGQEGEED